MFMLLWKRKWLSENNKNLSNSAIQATIILV
jgi:hypothetical protein